MEELRIAIPLEAPRSQRRDLLASSGFLGLCQESLRVCSRHAAPIVAFAFLGFAAVNVVGAAVAAYLIVSQYGLQGWTWQLFTTVYSTQWLLQGAVGLFAMAISRGALTWIALEREGASQTFGASLRAALRRFPSLFVVSAIYGGLITVGTLALIAYLRNAQLDISNMNRISGNYPDTLRAAVVRTLGFSIIPDPGAPFGDWIAYTRFMVRRMSSSAFAPGGVYYNPDGDNLASFGLIAIAFIVVIDALFRMRTAAVMARDASPLGALRASIAIGLRHFVRITLYAWSVRLGIALFMALFVWLPLTAIQAFLVPFIARELGLGWLYSTSGLIFMAATTLISMLFIAYSAVFDARLWRRLTPAQS